MARLVAAPPVAETNGLMVVKVYDLHSCAFLRHPHDYLNEASRG